MNVPELRDFQDWPALIGLPEPPRQALMMQCSEKRLDMNDIDEEHDDRAS